MIPELETATARTYVFYVGEPIGSVGLWKRYDDSLDEDVPEAFAREYPIFQNTRGRGIWNSSDTETSNVGLKEPTDAFWRALQQLASEQQSLTGGIDVDECEWYEVEAIQSVVDMTLSVDADDIPAEIGGLLAYADSGRWTDE